MSSNQNPMIAIRSSNSFVFNITISDPNDYCEILKKFYVNLHKIKPVWLLLALGPQAILSEMPQNQTPLAYYR